VRESAEHDDHKSDRRDEESELLLEVELLVAEKGDRKGDEAEPERDQDEPDEGDRPIHSTPRWTARASAARDSRPRS